MPQLVPINETEADARDRRFNELMDVRRTRHGRMLNTQTNYLKARGQNITEELGQERFDVQKQNLELNRIKELTNLLKQKAAIELQTRTQEHTVAALEGLRNIDPGSPDYHLKVADLFHNNPLATKDPLVQDIVKNQLAVQNIKETTRQEALRFEAKQGAEYAARWGMNPIPFPEGHPMAGRIDWDATDKERLKRAKERQDKAIEGLPAGMKPYQSTISKTGDEATVYRVEKEFPPDIIKTIEKPGLLPGDEPIRTTEKIIHVPAGGTAEPIKKRPSIEELSPYTKGGGNAVGP